MERGDHRRAWSRLTPRFEGDDELYAYAIGVVAGTAVQLAMCLPPLRRIGFPLRIELDFRDPQSAAS